MWSCTPNNLSCNSISLKIPLQTIWKRPPTAHDAEMIDRPSAVRSPQNLAYIFNQVGLAVGMLTFSTHRCTRIFERLEEL